jgi:hypothetical protein
LYDVIQYQQARLQQLELEVSVQQLNWKQEFETQQQQTAGDDVTRMMELQQSSESEALFTLLAPVLLSVPLYRLRQAVAPKPHPAPCTKNWNRCPVIYVRARLPASARAAARKTHNSSVTYGNGSTKEIHTHGTTDPIPQR